MDKSSKSAKASSWDHAERERERESSAHAEKKSRKSVCRLSVVEMFSFFIATRTFFLTFVFPFTFQLFYLGSDTLKHSSPHLMFFFSSLLFTRVA